VRSAHRWMTALVGLLLVLAVIGAALVVRTHGERADAHTSQERYGAVLAAADTEATAFVNIRYSQARRSVAAVAAGATGAFRSHYARSARHVIAVLHRQRSTMTGRVVWSGVSDISPKRATVIVATTGTVSNVRTHGKAEPRHFRLRVSLVQRAGRWLTSNLQFVGVGP
jgi:Mce-associated membrane protein